MVTATNEMTAEEEAPDELFRMPFEMYGGVVEDGLISDVKVELLDGLLVRKMTEGARHIGVTEEVFMLLLGCLPPGYYPRKEAAVNLPSGPAGDSAPEPDVIVLAGARTDFKRRIPVAADVRLAVEVAESSLAKNRRGLKRLAWSGIPVVWLVNLRDDTVEVYTGPTGPVAGAAYAEMIVKKPGDSLEITLDGATVGPISVADILS